MQLSISYLIATIERELDSNPTRSILFLFAWSLALYHEGVLRKGIVDYEMLIVKH
jgi:hypothetical protein